MFRLSMVIPRKVVTGSGSVTFFQDTLNPSSSIEEASISQACRHEAASVPILESRLSS